MNTYYALVNLNSESVRSNLAEIALAIKAVSQRTHCPVKFNYTQWILNCPEGWQHVDLQLEQAQGYTYILVFGGDGTHTYVLNKIAKYHPAPQFIGIACGTMNIGCASNSLRQLQQHKNMRTIQRDAICCQTNAQEHSFALIDSVITTTCVGRIDGVVSQFSAEDILNGCKRYAVPNIVGNEQTEITIQRHHDHIQIPIVQSIYTISTAFLSPALSAQVLAGGADPAACRCFTWGLIVSDFPLTWADAKPDDIQRKPITSIFYPLGDQDIVFVQGLNDNAYLVNDGNAICKTSIVRWHYEKDHFNVIKLGE